MKTRRRLLGLRFTTGHALVVAVLAPLAIIMLPRTGYEWAGPAAVGAAALLALVTVRGRRFTGWITAVFNWLRRPRRAPDPPSEPVVGATVVPGDHVAVRWQGLYLVSVIELIPRPFTPTVIVKGQAHTDDVLDTRLLQDLLSVHCPDLMADIVSSGYRVAGTATADVVRLYDRVIGNDPAPAHRRTWVMLRAAPERTRKSAQRRDADVAGLVRYLVASTTRIADGLASHGVDATCSRSFDDFDQATGINFKREKWATIKGRGSYTTAYTTRGGPDAWWSARADRTIATVRVMPDAAPQTTVLLTTAKRPKTPKGFSRLSGAQRAALQGHTIFTNKHCQLPIGPAGVLVGETEDQYPVYMPFDDVDVSINLGDAQAFTQFAVRAAAAGAAITVGPQFRQFAGMIGASVGPTAKVVWPTTATTFLGPHPGTERVILRHNLIDTPRHRQLPIQRVCPEGEAHYQAALPIPGQPRSPDDDHDYVPQPPPTKNRMAVAALVVGIIALLTSPTIVLGIVLGVLAVILGLVARRRVIRDEAPLGGVAVAGIVLGVLAIIAAAVSIFFWYSTITGRDFVSCMKDAGTDTAAQQQCVDTFQQSVQDRVGGTPVASAVAPNFSMDLRKPAISLNNDANGSGDSLVPAANISNDIAAHHS